MSRRHIPELDGVRGLAVLMVLFLHYWGGATFRNPIIHFTGVLVSCGWAGVSLFFVLSGFLITGIIWDDHNNPGWWKNFYARRVLRIFPLYYLCVLLLLITAFFAGNGALALHRIWVLVFYLQNAATNIDYYGSPLGTAHLWSLAVEEQFYLIWPLILSRCSNRQVARAMCVTIFLLSLVCRFATFLTQGLPLYLALIFARWGELSVGCYLALSFHNPHRWQRLYRVSRIAFPVLLAVALWAGFHRGSFSTPTMKSYAWGITLAALLCGGLLVLVLNNRYVGAIFRNGALRRLGTISYGFYLFHALLHPVFAWLADTTARHLHGVPTPVLRFFWAGTISYIVASISFRYFELPFLKLRSKYRTAGHTASV